MGLHETQKATVLAASLLLALTFASCHSDSHSNPAPPPAPVVEIVPAEQKTVPIYQQFLGQTAAINPVEIRPQVTGLLREIAFQGGATVKKGQFLFAIDPSTYEAALAQAQANLAQAAAALANDEKNLARDQVLYRAQVLPRVQLDTQTAQTQEARANVDATRAAVKTAQLNLGYTRIYAPIDGRIDEPSVKVGTLVTQNSTLLDTIYSINPIYVDFSVTERAYLNYEQAILKKGPEPPPSPQLLLPNQSNYEYPGRIVMANPAVNPNTGTLQLRAEFPNPEGLLRPGLSVRVKVMVREEANAVLIPQQAIQETQGQQSVYVVGAGDQVEFRPVVLGPTVDHMQVVNQGVKAGDRVIVQGQQKVRPGVKVEPLATTVASPAPPVAPVTAQTSS